MSDLPKHLSYASDLQAGDKFRANSSHVWVKAKKVIIHAGFVEIESVMSSQVVDYTGDAVFHVERKPETIEVDKAEYEQLKDKLEKVRELAGQGKYLHDRGVKDYARHVQLIIGPPYA